VNGCDWSLVGHSASQVMCKHLTGSMEQPDNPDSNGTWPVIGVFVHMSYFMVLLVAYLSACCW